MSNHIVISGYRDPHMHVIIIINEDVVNNSYLCFDILGIPNLGSQISGQER